MSMMLEPTLFKVLMPPQAEPVAIDEAFWLLLNKKLDDEKAAVEPILPTLPPLIKTLWLAALRCGRYRQMQGTMRFGHDAFCALGLLEHVCNRAHTYYVSDDTRRCIVMMNDGEHRTFSQIADWIEAYL